ncbi:hypothetical protein [Marilutibacter chinensis]|uniref:DUF11 domain-containing protein n=1 Tax=Marilutibacter chinensis TaxID=2912247 RepID=A0ABS9HTT9_9GAMM|nr:hypothetical protein [Lysobacter chinensis]MCF7221629.1 hypothetical protein [Lysobacter chinensis]
MSGTKRNPGARRNDAGSSLRLEGGRHRLAAMAICAVGLVSAAWSSGVQAQAIWNSLLIQDFGQGAEPVSSDPDAYLAPGTSASIEGEYFVLTNPSLANPAWQDAPDHTTGAGYMVLFNANFQSPYYLISAPVEVPGATYRVSYWAANAIRYDGDPIYSDGYIGLTVEDQPSGGTVHATGPDNSTPLPRAAAAGPLAWMERTVSFQLPVNYTANAIYLNFFNTSPLVPQGNDLVVDDIRVEMAMARVSGQIYVDNNANGVFDAGDETLAGSLPYVAVVDANDEVIDFVQIAVDGTYLLQNAAYSTSDIGQKLVLLDSAPALSQVITAATIPSGYGVVSETPNPTYGTTGTLPLDGILAVIRTDSATGDHSDFNIGLLALETDLSITKDDGQTAYTPGGTVVYDIVVGNAGPVDVTGAQIDDPLPSGIADATWTCGDATGGATCGDASGTGGIATTADLPAGSSVTYTLNMQVPIGFGGDLTNTATVAAPAGITDTDPSNNTASDTDTQFTSPPGPDPSVCNIADNGSFESPDIQNDPEGPGDNTAFVNGFAVWRTTTNPISGWQTVAGTIDILRHYNNASAELQSIDLWGTAAATLRQTFTGLVPGGQYTFSVDYSGLSATNSIAVVQLGNGVGATPVTLATLQPAADGIFNGNTGVPDTPQWSVTWGTYTHTFIAVGTEATIQFVNNAAPATQNTGLFVDNFIFAGDPCADLGVVKTVTPDAVVSGDEVVYTLQVANNGPDAADGALVTDAGVPGSLDCTALACSAAAGAVCPGAPTPAQLAAGLAIPTFPVGGTVTLELTCTVTATGAP